MHCPTCSCTSNTLTIQGSVLSQSTVSRTVTLRALDDDIDVLTGKLLEARRHRNTLVPAGRVPPELLGEIFLHCRAAAASKRYPSWIAVSHVSQIWRSTALAHSTLWNSPDLWYPELAAEMLLRVHSGPIYLQMSKLVGKNLRSKARLQRPVSIAIEIQSRISSLTFNGLGQEEIEVAVPLIPASSEWLKTLELQIVGGLYRELFISDTITTAPLYPALETLSGDPASGLPWKGPFLRSCPNLRHLRLTGHDKYCFPIMGEILDTLQTLPLLETLSLNHVQPTGDGPFPRWIFGSHIPPATRCVELVHLKKITLHGHTAAAVEYFMKHLGLPKDCRVSVKCAIAGGYDWREDHPLLHGATRDLIHRVFLVRPQSIRLDMSRDCLQILSSPEHTNNWTSDAATHHLFFCHVPKEYGYVNSFEAVVPFLSGLPLHITVSEFGFPNLSTWTVLLRNNGAAQVRITWNDASGFSQRCTLEDIGEIFALHDDALPHMDTLILQGINFAEKGNAYPITKSDHVTRIVAALQKRTAAGSFRMLRFVECTYAEQTNLAHWKSLLPVVWEEVEKFN